MGKFLGILSILTLLGGTFASAACTTPSASAASATSALPALPPLGVGMGVYYCAAGSAPDTIGDLSPAGAERRVQVCTTACSYEPMQPNDPHSLLIATSCGPGWHAPQYLYQPPAAAAKIPGYNQAPGALKLTGTSCSALLPSKGGSPGTQ